MHRAYAASIRLVALGILLAGSLSSSASAQSAEHDAAYRVITRLFDAMRARDTAAMRAAFVSNASTQTLTRDSVRFETIDGWLTSIGRAPAGLLLDERIANPVIHVDGDLASIWVDYWFFAGDRFSHCGVDAFLLARHSGEWRVFGLVDTRRTQGCAPAPTRRPS
ncbi:MAG: nuclear transport factor 2 family protein [Gemmatimonadetes bacterium]|jgi:hypothetical protein|nr:nuclear transport factor 2 family protein [Gemmatimonadota bacterium]